MVPVGLIEKHEQGRKAMTRWWKSHDLVEKPRPGGGKVNVVNDADITKPLLDMATRSR